MGLNFFQFGPTIPIEMYCSFFRISSGVTPASIGIALTEIARISLNTAILLNNIHVMQPVHLRQTLLYR